ncbi:MAG: hypothetical protein ACPGVV_02850 [Croceimicrobium sp.]
MNIEKLKNYNQKLLAFIGTILVLMGIMALILMGYFGIVEMRRDYRYHDEDKGIVAAKEIQKLQEEGKRSQIITYEEALLIDTINRIYLIPVSQVNLKTAEKIPERELLNATEYSSYANDYQRHYGDYNNLILYSEYEDSVYALFEDRVQFSLYEVHHFDDDILISIQTAKEDSDSNGLVNLLDHQSLHLYALKEKRLRNIKLQNASLQSYRFKLLSKSLMLSFGIDHNKNGLYESREPLENYQYHYEQEIFKPILAPELKEQLQKRLEGSK